MACFVYYWVLFYLITKCSVTGQTDALGEAFVNNVRINTKEITGYNASGEYWYHEGELAKITCKKIEGHVMNISLHRNDLRSISTQSLDMFEQTLHVKLTDKDNGTYLDCKAYKIFEPRSLYTVRVYFYKLPANNNNDLPTFIVNGLTLTPANDASGIKYVYEYYDGEQLSITGSMNNRNEDDKWVCMPSTEDVPEQLKTIGQHVNINITTTISHVYYTDCKKGEIALRLDLVPTIVCDNSTKCNWNHNSHPVISGLSMARTEIKYQQNKTTYITKYNINGYNTIDLSCASGTTGCYWNFSFTPVPTQPDLEESGNKHATKVKTVGANNPFKYNTTTNKYESKNKYQLLNNISSTVIIGCTCQSIQRSGEYSYLVEIMNEPTQRPNTPGATTENTTPIPGSERNTNKQGGFKMMHLPIIGVPVLVIFIIVWIIVGIHKRKRRLQKEFESDINYENLPNHNEGPMPTPAQWDTYSMPADAQDKQNNMYSLPYVPKTVEELYAQPQPKSQRQAPAETLYAEVGAQYEPSYAAIDAKGGKMPQNEYANLKQQMPAYSQIQPKKLRDNAQCAPQVLPKLLNEESYAKAVPTRLRKKADASNYANVFESQQYVNAPAEEDYAEPAYCEVNLKH